MRVAGTMALIVALALGSATPPTADATAVPRTPAAIRHWQSEEIADGLTLYRGTLGDPEHAGRWTVTVRFPGTHPADLGDADEADTLAGRLEAAGYAPRLKRIDWAPTLGSPGERLGWRIRVGAFADKEEAKAEAREIKQAGFTAVEEFTGADSPEINPAAEPSARVRVAIVDPTRYRGHVMASYGESLGSRETTTTMARAADADLAVNGGFFVEKQKDGIPGVPAGIGVYDGKLLSAATNGRVALLLDEMRMTRLFTGLSVRADGDSREIDGINRKPGLIRDCGGVGGDRPTERPRHDVTCTDPSEVVLFTPELGRNTPSSDGVEVVLGEHGRVVARRHPGAAVPDGGRVLAGIGEGAAWLAAHATPGSRLTVEERVWDQDGRPVSLDREDIVNGGPWLVRDGHIYLDVASDGIYYPQNPSFLYTWGIRRSPRTMLGVDAWGRLILVTADGRRPGYSDGLSLREGANFIRDLGAVNAINLDGGGSVTLVVNGRLDNRPSDRAGERPVGDALLFRP